MAALFLLHVMQPPSAMLSDVYAFDASQLTKMSATAEKAAARRLAELARHCTQRQARTATARQTGLSAAAIVAKAVSSRARYIVMGSHGHGAMYDLLVGSTTHGVLKKAPCPVVVVPPLHRRR